MTKLLTGTQKLVNFFRLASRWEAQSKGHTIVVVVVGPGPKRTGQPALGEHTFVHGQRVEACLTRQGHGGQTIFAHQGSGPEGGAHRQALVIVTKPGGGAREDTGRGRRVRVED